MLRVVIDTNVLVGGFYNARSAGRRLLEACLEGRIEAVVSPGLRAEYDAILPRAVRLPGWRERFEAFLDRARPVEPAEVPPVVPGDPSDDILFATAMAGGAGAIVTNDRLLLEIGTHRGIRVVAPRELVDEGV